MSLAAGTRLGPYEITGLIGAGGMGEIYRARDTRLNRIVAVKILKASAEDAPDLRQRFQREAKAISALSHPHICALHDVGYQDGVDYLVMEHLEGETLAERLRKGALPVREMFRIAIEVSDALDRAHSMGIVHRDLKPGNIMLTRDGAKVLDFGLAKMRGANSTALYNHSAAPTLTDALTAKGSIVGTLQYMAPEQLESGTGDARSDIFAFGAVLFEMATGRRAFEGNSQASVIAAIMRNDPPRASSFQPGSPGALDLLIANCLAKDPEQRWQNARDLRLQLQSIAQSIGQNDPAPPLRPVRSRRREAVAWLLAAALSALVVLLGIRQFRRTQQPSSTLSFTVPLPADAIDFPTTQTLAVSPDGRQLAIRAIAADGQAHIWLRPLGSIDSHLVPGTAGVENLSWSPDGRSLGFVLGNRLMKVSAEGGPPAAIADVMPDTADVTWSSRGDILFARYVDDVLYRLSERGGPFERYTTINSARHEVGHATPRFLPDGRRFLYSSRTQAGEGGVYLGSLQKPDGRLLIRGGWNGYYTAASGSSRAYIVYHRQMSLLAQAFDADREELSGEPFTVIGDPIVFPRDFSASQNGVLAYRAVPGEHLILGVDPDGRNQDTLSRPGDYRQIALSPDENTLALTRADTAAAGGGLSNIWLLDLSRHTFIRLTSSPTYDWCPVWSPDGKRIAFSSARSGRLDIYERAVSGAGTDALLLKSEFNKLVSSWSPDGRVLAYSESSGAMGNDIWILALEGDRKPFAFLQTQFNEFHPVFSPDGHWIAYTSDESGRPEIYVRKFEGTQASGRKWQISTNGGSHPKWRRDGKEIFYLSTDRKITAVALQTAPDLVAGAPKALFQTRLPATEYLWSYEPAAKGQRFLLNSPAGDVGSQAIKVIVGWNGAPAPAR